jgi:hypothetical protein
MANINERRFNEIIKENKPQDPTSGIHRNLSF